MLRRELQEAQSRVGDESSWVPHTHKYQQMCAEVERLQEALAQRVRPCL